MARDRAERRSIGRLALALAALGIACSDRPPTTRESLESQTYLTPDGTVTLEGGEAPAEGPEGIAYRLRTSTEGDLDLDGEVDAAVIIVEDDGDQRLVRLHALLSDGARLEDVSARLIGDRIDVRRLSIEDGLIRADLLTRQPGQPFTAEPTVPTAAYYALTQRGLVAVSAAAAGLSPEDDSAAPRASPTDAAPTLFSHTWELASFEMGDWSADLATLERLPELRFVPELADPGGTSGELGGTTGCNLLFGRFRAEGDATLRFSGLATTRRACSGQVGDVEQRLLAAYESVESYGLTGSTLEVRFVGGVLRFAAGAPLPMAGPSAPQTEVGPEVRT